MAYTVSIPLAYGALLTVTADSRGRMAEDLSTLADSFGGVAETFKSMDGAMPLIVGHLRLMALNFSGSVTTENEVDREIDADKIAEAVLRETIVVEEPKPAKKPKKAAAEPKPPKMNGAKKVDAPVSLPAVDVAQLRAQAVVWMDDVYRAGDEKDDDSGIDRVVELLASFGAKSSKDIPDDQFADFAASVESIHAEHVGS